MPSDRKHFSKTKPMELKHFDECIEWWNNRVEIEEDGFAKTKKFTAAELTSEDINYNLDQCGYPHKEEIILNPIDLINLYQEERSSLNAEIDHVLEQITNILGGK